jgi:WXG100 family type VII secretion target
MAYLKVSAEELESLAGAIQARAATIQQETAVLNAQIAPMAVGWAGPPSAQFNALVAQQRASTAQLLEALEGIAKLLAQASDNYRATEASITSSFTD